MDTEGDVNEYQYYGWHTYQTWLVNLWLTEYGMDELLAKVESPNDIKDAVERFLVAEADTSSLVADIVNFFLHDVDWRELYDAYTEGYHQGGEVQW